MRTIGLTEVEAAMLLHDLYVDWKTLNDPLEVAHTAAALAGDWPEHGRIFNEKIALQERWRAAIAGVTELKVLVVDLSDYPGHTATFGPYSERSCTHPLANRGEDLQWNDVKAIQRTIHWREQALVAFRQLDQTVAEEIIGQLKPGLAGDDFKRFGWTRDELLSKGYIDAGGNIGLMHLSEVAARALRRRFKGLTTDREVGQIMASVASARSGDTWSYRAEWIPDNYELR